VSQELERQNWDKAVGKHQDRIQNWIGRQQKNHIRVLLCTLHSVLWPKNGWQIIGMDKLLDHQEVKKCYRKATMLCHPDKVKNSVEDPDKVYIANMCFAAITEAYNRFKKEEGIQ
jgi:DnaJ-class molecular chaperone